MAAILVSLLFILIQLYYMKDSARTCIWTGTVLFSYKEGLWWLWVDVCICVWFRQSLYFSKGKVDLFSSLLRKKRCLSHVWYTYYETTFTSVPVHQQYLWNSLIKTFITNKIFHMFMLRQITGCLISGHTGAEWLVVMVIPYSCCAMLRII